MEHVFVATFCDWKSYGSIYQAIGLKKALEGIGVKSTILEAKEKPSSQYCVAKPSRKLRSILLYMLNLTNQKAMRRKCRLTCEYIEKQLDIRYLAPLETELQKLPEDADYLCGSDQIWNPKRCHSLFFLDFPIKGKKLSYAASFGTLDVDQEKEAEFSRLINGFEEISVRERMAVPFLAHYTDKPVKVHIDPTFLLSKAFWVEQGKAYPHIKSPYILVYAIYWDSKLNSKLKALSKRTGKAIVAVSNGYQPVYADQRIYDADPAEFLWLIEHADAVVSSSFHGVALSINLNKPLAVVNNPASPSRIQSLLDILGIPVIDIEHVLDEKVDYQTVNRKIAAEREKGICYLKEKLLK